MHNPKEMPESYFELLRRHQVQKKTGLSRSGIYAAIREKTFPKPVKIGSRAVAWRKNEVDRWIFSRKPTKGEGE